MMYSHRTDLVIRLVLVRAGQAKARTVTFTAGRAIQAIKKARPATRPGPARASENFETASFVI